MVSAVPWLSRKSFDAAQYLETVLDVYREFPPVAKAEKTRWGDDWSSSSYPTLEPLLKHPIDDTVRVFWEEASAYTWICYARLRQTSERPGS